MARFEAMEDPIPKALNQLIEGADRAYQVSWARSCRLLVRWPATEG
jgi:hypothetical protein